MSANDDHWPSLPPIRTSSCNSRVSCETLNLHTPPAATTSVYTHTTPDTPPSFSHRPKPTSESAAPSAHCSQTTSPTHAFSSCFPQKFSKGHGYDRRRGGTQAHWGGAFDATGLLRSVFGFSSPMVSYTSGASPSNWQSPQPNRQTPPSMTSSPSGRTSPINSVRTGGATPLSGVVLRSSKGHAAHAHAFTMMPPDVVGKKKPQGYESDEPTSPEVTCIGKVRRKHCKATWDALVKEKHKDAKKKGKGKKITGGTPRMSDFVVCGKKHEGEEPTTACEKFSRQRSEKRRSPDFGGFPSDFDTHSPRYRDLPKEDLVQGMDDARISKAWTESRSGDAHTHGIGSNLPSCANPQSGMLETESKLKGESVRGAHLGDVDASLCDESTESGAPAVSSEMIPPPNCLLLMKKGSRNRSSHCSDQQALHEPGHPINQWNLRQVLT